MWQHGKAMCQHSSAVGKANRKGMLFRKPKTARAMDYSCRAPSVLHSF